MIRNEAAKLVFFENLVQNQREEVLSWLRFKYINLPYADAEDIYQEASLELWKKLCKMDDWNGESMTGMLKAISRNVHGHWLRRQVRNEDWDDKYYPQDNGVEADYGYINSGTARMLLKEQMYEMIEHLTPQERSLMEMHLKNVRMDQIAQKLGYKNAQVARNHKCKIVVKLSNEINAQAATACASFFIVECGCYTGFIKIGGEQNAIEYSVCYSMCYSYVIRVLFVLGGLTHIVAL